MLEFIRERPVRLLNLVAAIICSLGAAFQFYKGNIGSFIMEVVFTFLNLIFFFI